MKPKDSKKEKIIREAGKLWYEGNDLYIRAKVRAGLYYLQIGPTTYIDFLADVYHKDTKEGRVFKFVGIRETKKS